MTKDWFKISLKKVKFLLTYYILLFLIGLTITIFTLLHDSFHCTLNASITLISMIGGIGTALVGSTIFYLRKLYKACINKEMSSPQNEDDYYKQIGIFFYYFLRPLFAIAFSALIHIVIKSSVDIVTVKDTQFAVGFIYLTMFLSFFAGFAAGDLIIYIESKSQELATKIFKGH